MPSYISTIDTPDGSSHLIRPTLESLATIGITPGGNDLNYSYDAGPTICGSSGTYPVSQYSLIMEKPDGTWEKITATSASQSTATTKTVNTSGFLLNHIKYYTGNNMISGKAILAANTCYSKAASVDMRYSTNCGTSTDWHSSQYFYLVGNIDRDGYFYLDTTRWWDVDLPNTADGKLYIQIGSVLNTEGTTISFLDERPVLYYDADLGIQLYGGTGNSSGDYLPLAGGTMSGAIDMGSQPIKHLAAGYGDDNAVRYDQVLPYDPHSDAYTAKGYIIQNVAMAVNDTDAVNLKCMTNYVDTAIAPKFNDTDVSIENINGQNDFNIAYTYYDTRSYQVLTFGGGPMSINTVCHIFVYYCGAAQNPGTYSGGGYFGIPNDIIVGNHASDNKNHVWINGKKVNGGSISGSGNVTYFQTPSPGGIVEISVAYNKFGLQYRTFIKVDAPEASI